MTRLALMVLLFTASTSSVLARGAPPRCDLPEHRQFDFWVGDWSVTDWAVLFDGTYVRKDAPGP